MPAMPVEPSGRRRVKRAGKAQSNAATSRSSASSQRSAAFTDYELGGGRVMAAWQMLDGSAALRTGCTQRCTQKLPLAPHLTG